MGKKVVFGIVLTLLVVSMLTSAFNLAIAGVNGVGGEGELSSSASSAQPSLIWSKTYGGDAEDHAYCVRQTSDGGYILVGYTYSFGAGDMDVWLVKTDANGNMEWNRTYGGAGQDCVYSVQQTSDGGYIFAGGSDSFSEYGNIYVIKTDAYGNVEWNITSVGEFPVGGVASVQQTSDGGYILGGGTLLVKIDANGNTEWYKILERGESHWWEYWCGWSVQQTSDGGYMLAGEGSIYNRTSGEERGFWLAKTDANGNMEWNNIYGRFGFARAFSGQQTSDGGYMVAGYLAHDAWLVKTDTSGNMEWNRTYGGEYSVYVYSSQQTSDDGYILAGRWGTSYPKVWLLKTDASGNMEWNATYGELDWVAESVQQISDDGYIVAGFTKYWYDSPPSDFVLMKLGIKHDVAVTNIHPLNNVVAQNHSVFINVTVENQGDSTETFNVTAYASTTAIGTLIGITLTSGNSITITFTWNTRGFIEGVYIISATVTPVPYETETADNTYVDGLVVVGAGPPGNLIWVNPPLTDNLQGGNVFVVDLMINITDPDPINSPPYRLFGFEYKLKWNATILEVESIQFHSPWPEAYLVAKNEIDVGPDGRQYHWLAISADMGATPFTGTTSLCTYTFHVNYQPYYSEPDYTGRLDIYDDKLVDDQAKLIAHTTYDGQYRIPFKVPVHDVAITGIALSKTIVGQGYSMNITVTVKNQGSLPETFIITAYCNTTSIATQAITLAGGNSYTLTFTWNTTGFAKGVYAISANVTIVPGETDTGDNSYTDGTVRVSIPGDVNGDRIVDIYDLVYMATSFRAEKGKPPPPNTQPYKPNADINGDDILDIFDIVIIGIHYRETYP